MKKLLSVVLVVLMIFSCFSIISFAEESADHLTEVPEGYVGVYTKDDLMKVHYDATAKYILMNDISFSSSDFDETYNDGNGWIPYPEFSGVFDGNDYKISNLRISGDVSNVGFFSSLTSTAEVKNLFIENIDIDVTGDKVGGITGSINCMNATNEFVISNCIVSGEISGGDYVAGFCGYASLSRTTYIHIVAESCNAANIIGSSYVGGIIGMHRGYSEYFGYAGSGGSSSYIEKCINTGMVKGAEYIGGIVGRAHEPVAHGTYGGPGYSVLEIDNTFNSGGVTGNKFCGGIIGGESWADVDRQIKLSNCYSSGDIASNDRSDFGAIIGTSICEVNNVYYVNKSVNEPTVNKGTALTTDQLKLINMGVEWTFGGRADYPFPELMGVPFVFPHIHEYTSAVTTPATHILTGVMTYTCSCGDTYTEVIEKTADHSYNAAVTSPTCTKQGFTTYTCECGDSYIDDYIDANGHREGGWVVTKPATTTSTGTKTQNCSVCGELLATEIIPMLPSKVHSVLVSGVSLDYKSTGTIATAINADAGTKYTVTYSSSNTSVATVDENGNVYAAGTGSATITCTVTDEYGNTVTDTCEVEVKYSALQWIIVIVLFGWIWY